jgi:predicted phosphodiesterase
MTRVALLSDIHGNLVALEAVLADMARRGPFDRIIVAGDLAWSGPWPAEVVDRVRGESGAVVIQGNTDAFFRRRPDDTPAGKREGRFAEQLAWMAERLGPGRVRYLADLPFSYRVSPAPGHDLLVVHANPVDLDHPIMPKVSEADLDDLLLIEGGAEPDWSALAFGHVHVPFTRQWRGRLLVDVSSTGLPMDGDPRAVYAILIWDGGQWHAEHHRVFYDVPVVAHQMRHGGMPRGKHFAERLMAANYNTVMPMLTAAVE